MTGVSETRTRAFPRLAAACPRPRMLEHGSAQFIVLSMALEPGVALTSAERDLARCLVDGKSDQQIALARRVSVRTVVNQMVALRCKLGVSSRRELVSQLWNACLVAEPGGSWPQGPEPCASLSSAELGALRARALESDQSCPPGPVFDLWQELIIGNLSLVDRFDAGGRRYLLTRKNSSDVALHKQSTPREAQVASRVAAGQRTKVIAYELGVRPSTVSTHLENALSKFGARNTADLSVAWGMAHARRE